MPSLFASVQSLKTEPGVRGPLLSPASGLTRAGLAAHPGGKGSGLLLVYDALIAHFTRVNRYWAEEYLYDRF